MVILRGQPKPAIQKLQAAPNSSRAAEKTLFPAGLTAEAEFHDVDQLTSTIRSWDHSVVQLGRGTFHGSLSLIHTSSLQLYRATWSPAFLVQGRVPAGSIVFGVQCGGTRGAVWHGRELVDGDVLLLDSHQELDLQTKGACDMLVLSIGADLFAQHAEALRGRLPTISNAAAWNLQGRPAVQRQLVRHWMGLLDSALSLGHRLCDHDIAARIEAETIEMLLIQTTSPVREAPMADRRRAALRARQYMVLNMDEPLTMKDICQAVHAYERTLHLGFQETFGTTPKRFLKTLRLNAVRRDLRRAQQEESVTDLACRRGFFHFSNFAADYRRQFGELPSETLRRSRQVLDAGIR